MKFIDDIRKEITPQLKSKIAKATKPALAEISGKDSLATAIRGFEMSQFDLLLPTFVNLNVEYGDRMVLTRNIRYLQERVKKLAPLGKSWLVLEPITMEEPELWQALSGRFNSLSIQRFGSFSPCLGCHLFVHLLRAPLAWELGIDTMITGERQSHHGRVKINQLSSVLDRYESVMDYAGIKLISQLRYTISNGDIDLIMGKDFKDEDNQLKCILEDNYRDLNDAAIADESGASRYLDEFAVPFARAVIDLWRKDEEEVSYIELAKKVFGNRE
ncbi:MAG: hypothetical protein QMD53_06845 [Actinomycetota bacterium]|nr:hypothetical protein [Actinomycetota bacterium]